MINLPFFLSQRFSKQSPGAFSTIINKLAVISIILALSVLLLAFMVLYGFKSTIKDKIYSLSGHFIINKYTLNTSFEETPITLNDELLNVLQNEPYISHFQPYANKAGLLKTDDEVQGVILKGVDTSFDTRRFKKNIIDGHFPSFNDDRYSTNILLSKKIANYLKLSTGDQILIFFIQNPPRYRKLQITGIYETGLEEFDDKIIIGDIKLIRRINNWSKNQVGGLEVFVHHESHIQKTEKSLFYDIPNHLYSNTVSNIYAQLFDWLNLLDRNVIVLLTIVLFVSCTSIIAMLLILIMERTQTIGLLKSLGASDLLIQKVFVWNGVKLLIKGLIYGNIIGLGLGYLQDRFKIITLDQANYYMHHVPIEFDLLTILGLNILMFLLIAITLFIPVAFISNISPINALKYD